jgi:hypothetical protein
METKALETVLERLLESYQYFKDTFASLATMKTIQSTSVIKIVRDRNKPVHHSFMPMGILNRETLEGRIKIMEHLLGVLDSFSADFVKTRYYEMQSRDFTIRYLKIGSVSTYKRIRHRVLRNCFQALQQIEILDAYFPELQPIFQPDFKISHQLTDEEGNPISSEEQSE